MSETTYYQRNRDVIVNKPKGYYKNDKETLRDNAGDNTEIYLKKKKAKREHGRNRYDNMSKEKEQKLKEYQKHYREAKRSQFNYQ